MSGYWRHSNQHCPKLCFDCYRTTPFKADKNSRKSDTIFCFDWCQLNDIGQLVIGNNQRWKQDLNIGKRNNQQFPKIPHAKLISLLTYKAQLVGIEVFLTEESYTSKASALDGDQLPAYNSNSQRSPVFSGKRIKRGLYKTSTGRIVNADTNGSLNIARKVIPNFMNGIEGLPFIPVVLGLWTKITNLVV